MEKRLNKNEFSDWMHEEMLLNKEANLLSNYFAYKGYIDLGFSKQKAQSIILINISDYHKALNRFGFIFVLNSNA